MPAGFRIARVFFIAGAALAFVGLMLWWRLPISMSIPPYLFTSLLALAYGFYCWKKSPPPRPEKEESRE